MKTSLRVLGLLVVSIGISFAAEHHGSDPHWGYTGKQGPEHWSTLSSKFKACSGGRQSPVDLGHFVEANLPPIAFDYKTGGRDFINNGHTVQVDYDPGSSISIGNDVFMLKQFHFHAPSENHIGGRSFPIEAHFVHADASGNLAVVAVMFVQGASNPALEQLWARLPAKAEERKAMSPGFAAASLLPAEKDYYRYDGSLTTPPCSEGVRWLVLKAPVTASAAQISRLTTALGHPNNRPVQPIGTRVIEE
ncbi:MAG: carbonic anhydrase [Luteimonas sp.]